MHFVLKINFIKSIHYANEYVNVTDFFFVVVCVVQRSMESIKILLNEKRNLVTEGILLYILTQLEREKGSTDKQKITRTDRI